MRTELWIGIGGLAASTAAELLLSDGLALVGVVLTAVAIGMRLGATPPASRGRPPADG